MKPKLDRSEDQLFSRTLADHNLALYRKRTEILQLNVGKLCNLTCTHCHVNAGPKRKEIISSETIDRILEWLAEAGIHTVDLTGGAPEMAPDFRYLVERLRRMPQVETIIDRCNLTVLFEPGYEWLAGFLAAHQLKIIASMPCYEPDNVDAQRGEGVFDSSIRALQLLNRFGYGRVSDLLLDLVYNPNGDFLPPDQAELEADYKRELKANFDIDFNRLYTLTNMPIGRFASGLKHSGKLEAYMQLLRESFNPASIPFLMCHSTLSVDWQGIVYDCDFNQQLGMRWRNAPPLFLWDLNPTELEGRSIALADHCFGCAAGCGSSCGGALV
jgi:radical SAM/Cys-rich protein